MPEIEDVVITGDGFLAYAIYRHLREHAPATRTWNFTLHNGQDIRNHESLRAAIAGKNLVIHTAALTHVQQSLEGGRLERQRFLEVNHLGTFNVLEACRDCGVKLIHISSSEVYGTNRCPGSPQTEDHPLVPQAGTYAVSKAAADHECRVAFECFDQDVVILRPFNLYGPAQAVEKLIPRFLHQSLTRQALTVHGDGSQCRDYVYTPDVAAAIWEARRFPAGTICNVGTGHTYSVLEVARLVSEIVERKHGIAAPIVHVPDRPNNLPELCGSFDRIQSLCAWCPRVLLPDGIERVLDWLFLNGPVQPPQHALLGSLDIRN